MKCPACENQLQMSTREGIEIDYCPTCRGVWLDRGELDKLIERSNRPAGPGEGSRRRVDDDDDDFDDDNMRGGRRGSEQFDSHHPRKKRESFWSEFFDFG
ncbi:MAG: zf-TFIIB domain-containing protein [Pirellulales bacterium]|nr:zf-TFIIB domain-containing protein [Pirellulales bacterium]